MSNNQENNLDWAADIMSWLPQIYGKEVGTGSGLKLTEIQLRGSGQVFTGYELLEFEAQLVPHPFTVEQFLAREIFDYIEWGLLLVVEPPKPDNELGKYRFDPKHPYNVPHSLAWSKK